MLGKYFRLYIHGGNKQLLNKTNNDIIVIHYFPFMIEYSVISISSCVKLSKGISCFFSLIFSFHDQENSWEKGTH